jgi:hypothetical protein
MPATYDPVASYDPVSNTPPPQIDPVTAALIAKRLAAQSTVPSAPQVNPNIGADVAQIVANKAIANGVMMPDQASQALSDTLDQINNNPAVQSKVDAANAVRQSIGDINTVGQGDPGEAGVSQAEYNDLPTAAAKAAITSWYSGNKVPQNTNLPPDTATTVWTNRFNPGAPDNRLTLVNGEWRNSTPEGPQGTIDSTGHYIPQDVVDSVGKGETPDSIAASQQILKNAVRPSDQQVMAGKQAFNEANIARAALQAPMKDYAQRIAVSNAQADAIERKARLLGQEEPNYLEAKTLNDATVGPAPPMNQIKADILAAMPPGQTAGQPQSNPANNPLVAGLLFGPGYGAEIAKNLSEEERARILAKGNVDAAQASNRNPLVQIGNVLPGQAGQDAMSRAAGVPETEIQDHRIGLTPQQSQALETFYQTARKTGWGTSYFGYVAPWNWGNVNKATDDFAIEAKKKFPDLTDEQIREWHMMHHQGHG